MTKNPASGRVPADVRVDVTEKSTDRRGRAKEERHPASYRTRWLTAIRESDLERREALVAMTLATWMDVDGRCNPALPTIAAGARLHPSGVKRALAVLERREWIARERGGGKGRSTRYQASIPAHVRARLEAEQAHPGAKQAHQRALNRRTSAPGSTHEVSKEEAPSAVNGSAPPQELTDWIDRNVRRRSTKETSRAS